MDKAGISVIILFLVYAVFLSSKENCDTTTAYNRYLTAQSISEPAQTNHTLFKEMYSEPLAARCGTNGRPIRRVGGNIYTIVRWPSTTACESRGIGS